MRRTADLNKNLLSEQIECQPWYIQHPLDEEISDDQTANMPHLSPNKTSTEIICKKGLIFSITYRRFSSVVLSRIFRRVGADFENRLLDCTKPSLCMQLTNEFIHNNIHISSTDLQNFIELYFNEKQKSSRKFPSLQTIYSVL